MQTNVSTSYNGGTSLYHPATHKSWVPERERALDLHGLVVHVAELLDQLGVVEVRAVLEAKSDLEPTGDITVVLNVNLGSDNCEQGRNASGKQ